MPPHSAPLIVTLHPGGTRAFVYRQVEPRCLLTFALQPDGAWRRATVTWFQSPSGKWNLDAIEAEARQAIELAVLERPGPDRGMREG